MALKVGNYVDTRKITIAKPTPQPTLKVGVARPTQNIVVAKPTPQPRLVVAKPAPTPKIIVPRSIPTAQQVQAQAQALRVAVAQQVTQKINVGVAQNKQKITTGVSKSLVINSGGKPINFNGKLKVGNYNDPRKIVTPEQSEYDKAYAKAYYEAEADFNKQREPGKKNFAQKAWDKISFGQDRRDSGARAYAEKKAKEIMDRDFKGYEERVNKYISKQAQAQSAVNKAATTMSQKEFDAFVAQQQSEIDKEYNSLQSEAARYDGKTAAYGKSAGRPLTSFASKALSKAAKFASDENPVWKYTLGGGDKNIPSIVSAPSRVINFVGNINTKDRNIYQEGGGTFNRKGSKSNAWQATQNQRSFNLRPWTDVQRGEKADSILGNEVRSLIKARKDIGVTDPDKLDYDKVMEERLSGYNRSHRGWNSTLNIVADPLNIAAGAGAAVKGTKFGSKILSKVKLSKPAQFVSKHVDDVKNNSWYTKLTTEHKSSSEKLRDAIAAAKNKQDELHKTLLPRVNDLNKRLNKSERLDVTVFDDLARLTDWESDILQRADKAGNLSRRDLLRLAGQKQTKANIEAVAKKWVEFSQKMAAIDDVGKQSGRIYKPYTGWVRRNGKSLDEYDFRMRKTRNVRQSSDDFVRSAKDRYFKSGVDDAFAEGATKNRAKLVSERNQLVKQFDDELMPLRDDVDAAYAKTRTLRGRTERFVENYSPNALWKKSVLKYRPAWYVNNELYNTQAVALAGGARGLVEKVKMVRPKYFRKAMKEVPEEVKSKLSKEIGRGRLSKLASRQENWSRVAAFRGAKARGLTDKEALKRVDSYLFDYSIKNWERPFKAVIPFWSFQKNLAKAGAKMPFDRPLAAIGYNRLDQYQQNQFEKDFDKVVPELEKLGYTQEEIEQFRKEQSKYFKGRLKVGNKYITTPFNAFSEKQMSHFGINPFLSAARETSESVDSFGRPITGSESGFVRRMMSKFPQAELARQFKLKRDVDAGKLKPVERYIGKPGSEGYGLGKEKQGYDPTKANYVESKDPRRKLGQNALAFVGVPRGLEFDKPGFVKNKVLQKVTQEYFNTDWKGMEYEDAQAKQRQLFEKYGMSEDDFYKGILSKYDTENTTRIKGMKEDARAQNQSLLDEYGKQPYGTRSAWAVKKLQELNESGYYGENPFLYSFVKGSKFRSEQGWLTPETIARANLGAAKKADYEYAIRTGDWSKWRNKYGIKSAEARIVQKALSTGDWSEWRVKYGSTSEGGKFWSAYRNETDPAKRRQMLRDNPKYAKRTPKTEAEIEEGAFWARYAAASKDARRQLLADNPQYNRRAGWTSKQWLAWKDEQRKTDRGKVNQLGNFASVVEKFKVENTKRSKTWQARRRYASKKVAFRLS